MVYHGVDTTRNIIIKLTYQSDYEDENDFVGEGPSNRGLSAVESNQTLNNLDKNKPLRSWWKHFGKEMLSYDVLFDALFLNSRADDRFLCMSVLRLRDPFPLQSKIYFENRSY